MNQNVVLGHRDVGLHPMGPGFLCDRVDELIVPAGEHDLMTNLRSQFDYSRADDADMMILPANAASSRLPS